MGALTAEGANRLLDDLTNTGATGWGSTVYAALSSTDPATSVTEPSGGSYARVAVALNGSVFPAASGRQAVSASAVTFPTASASWGTLPYVAFYTAASGGSLLFHDQLPTAVVVASGDTPTIPAGGLVLSA